MFALAWIATCLGLLCRAQGATPKSLVIAVDGLRADSVNASLTPHLDRLIQGGFGAGHYRTAYAYYAQTIQDAPTVSGPNHASIMTGVTSVKHQVTSNSTLEDGQFTTYPHYLARAESANSDLNTAYLVTWESDLMIPSGADYVQQATDAETTTRIVKMLQGTLPDEAGRLGTRWQQETDIDAIFMFFDDPDAAGHNHGWTSTAYLDEVHQVDTQIGEILSAVETRPSFDAENWQIVVTSDHGGFRFSHGEARADNYTIPFLVSSRTAAHGLLAGTPSNVDTASTALDHLGVPLSDDLDGRVQGFEIRQPNQTSLAESLIAYWPFDGSYDDHSPAGNAHPATPHGVAPTLHATDGKLDGYVEFDSDAAATEPQFVSLGQPADLGLNATQDFSVTLWYRLPNFQSGPPLLVSLQDRASPENPGWSLLPTRAPGRDRSLAVELADGTGPLHAIDRLQANLGEWTFAAATFEYGGNALLYAGDADGQLRFVSDDISDVTSFTSALALNVGQDGTGGHPHALDADIDELALWNRALSREQIGQLYHGGAGQPVTALIPEPGMARLLLIAFSSAILLIRRGSRD